jgi:hypothetical protein
MSSLTLQAKVFQLFQPIGGVSASSSNFCAKTVEAKSKLIVNTSNLIVLIFSEFIDY